MVLSGLLAGCLNCSAAAEADPFDGWKPAVPGWVYEFPRDHHAHHDFRTEWWYFTGNLFDSDNRRFGFQVTFFRSGIIPPRDRREGLSRFVQQDLKFAHFAVTDVEGKRFLYHEERARGAFGEAGFGEGHRLAWIHDSYLDLRPDGGFETRVVSAGLTMNLEFELGTEPTFHGKDGASAKGEGFGNATHYYTYPRLKARGTITLDDGIERSVEGLAWLDREWGSNLLGENQVGWDWFSLQFDSGDSLMMFQLRGRDGAANAASGTWMPAHGEAVTLEKEDIQLHPMKHWQSVRTGGRYPIGWRVEIPRLQLEFEVTSPLANQELVLGFLNYWEGAIDARGSKKGVSLSGMGYLEMTGYAGEVRGLRSGD